MAILNETVNGVHGANGVVSDPIQTVKAEIKAVDRDVNMSAVDVRVSTLLCS